MRWPLQSDDIEDHENDESRRNSERESKIDEGSIQYKEIQQRSPNTLIARHGDQIHHVETKIWYYRHKK